MRAMSHVSGRFLRITSGASSADLLAADLLTHILFQALLEIETMFGSQMFLPTKLLGLDIKKFGVTFKILVSIYCSFISYTVSCL